MHTFPGYLDSLTAGSRDIKTVFKQVEPLSHLRTESLHWRQIMMIKEGKGNAATAIANFPHSQHIRQNDTDGLQVAADF